MILATKSLIFFSSFAYLASQPARVRIPSSSPFVEFYESHTHTVDMFIRASEQQRQAYGYTAESKCVTITANVRILQVLSGYIMTGQAREGASNSGWQVVFDDEVTEV